MIAVGPQPGYVPHEKTIIPDEQTMPEYHEMVKEAAEARVGANRMAAGLPCIPDPLRGDLETVERLRAALRRPITMQDVRLAAGEGKLQAHHVLMAVNTILNRRAADHEQ